MRLGQKFFLWVAERIKEAALARAKEGIQRVPCARPRSEQQKEFDQIDKAVLPCQSEMTPLVLNVRMDVLEALQGKGISAVPFLSKALNRQLHQISAALIDS